MPPTPTERAPADVGRGPTRGASDGDGAPCEPCIPIEAIEAARDRIAPHLKPTPVRRLEAASAALGAEVVAKLEFLQPTRAFKVRGALNAVLSLDDDARSRGVIAASAGNHGLGLCFAARVAACDATVVLPETSAPERVEDIRSLGGRVVLHGDDWNAANARATELAERDGQSMIPPFDHPDVMAGQGTIALELLDQCPDVEVVACSIGGGGLIAGIASALRARAPHVRVVGVETEGADSMARSLAAGAIAELSAFTSVAKSLGARSPSPRTFEIVRAAVDEVIVVSDEAALGSLVDLLDAEKFLVEPAASCVLAALLDGSVADLEGRVVAPILCGANATLGQLVAWLDRYELDLTGRPRS